MATQPQAKSPEKPKPAPVGAKPGETVVTQTGPASVSATTKPAEARSLVPVIKKSALQLEVGPAFVAAFARADADEQKAFEAIRQAGIKKYDQLRNVTMAIVHAATQDDSIDLARAFSKEKKDQNLIGEQISLALGIREIVDVDGKKRTQIAKAVAKFFPGPKDDKESDDYKRKSTLRTNISHQLKKCMQAAAGVMERNIKIVSAEGTLQISGPTVKEVFGAETVLLNEKQKQGDVELKVKPSFQKLAEIGAEAMGAEVRKRNQQVVSAAAAPAAVDKTMALKSICQSLIMALGKFDDAITPELKTALEGARNAINEKLK